MTPEKPKTYYCPWLEGDIPGVAARGCNYCNLDNNTCRHDDKPCVAKEGLELFAQSLPKETEDQRDREAILAAHKRGEHLSMAALADLFGI